MHQAGRVTADAGRPERRPRRSWRGKRGVYDQDALTGLADRVADLAAEEVRRLVHTAAGLAQHGDHGVLEAIERAAQQSAAQIGLAAVTAVLNWAGAHTPAHACCPGPDHPGPDHPGPDHPGPDTAHTGPDTAHTGPDTGPDTAHTGPDTGPDTGRAARLVARRTKTVRTLLGSLDVVRGYYHCGSCRHGFAPLDTRLGITGTSLSPGLARACALAGAEMPYATSRQFIAAVTGLNLASTSTLARTTRTQGARARNLINAEHAAAAPGPVPAADTSSPDLCYIVLDGTGAPMLPRECHDRPGKGPDAKARTREVKIGCFFTQSHHDPITGEPLQDPGSATYISTFEAAATFATHTKAEYHRRGFDQIRQPIILGDGAKWIWALADQQIPHATQIVDYFHAREHLAELTRILTPALADPTAFEQHLIDHLDLGHTAQIATAVDQLNLPHHAPDLVKPAATEVGYFTTNHHRMQYADFRANSYYIGSGTVESACNTIVKQRAKRAGMHWTIHGLDPILALRTLRQSQREHILWPTPQT